METCVCLLGFEGSNCGIVVTSGEYALGYKRKDYSTVILHKRDSNIGNTYNDNDNRDESYRLHIRKKRKGGKSKNWGGGKGDDWGAIIFYAVCIIGAVILSKFYYFISYSGKDIFF